MPMPRSAFSDVAEKVTSAPVQAAALYNSGTIRAGLPEAASSDFGEAELLFAVFQEDEPIQSYLDDQELIDTLIQAGVSLGQAVRDLQGAVRTSDADEDTRKNLELAGKRHRAVVASIQRLFEVGSPLPEAQKDALADVLNMKMPEEFKLEDKGKDNSNYLIMEKF